MWIFKVISLMKCGHRESVDNIPQHPSSLHQHGLPQKRARRIQSFQNSIGQRLKPSLQSIGESSEELAQKGNCLLRARRRLG